MFMKSRYLILVPIILLALLIPLAIVRNQTDAFPIAPPTEPVARSTETAALEVPTYTTAPPSPDGIGKIFMGREISHVMGHQGLNWLERDEREMEEAPSRAIALLDLAPDAVIADIGAGSGYYSFRIAPLVARGKVIAVDIQQEMFDFLKAESTKREVTNVQPHLGTIEDIQLPPDTLDAALMVDSYHEFSHPIEMLTSLQKALKPGGKIYLLEYRAEDPRVPIKPLHKMSEAQARKEFEALGFTFVKNKPGLPWQHFLVFEKSQNSNFNSQ
jgi:SAM-dependent methyltransferase